MAWAERAARIVRPPPDRKPDEWAVQAKRRLPSGSAEKGQYRPGRTPYIVPIARAHAMWQLREVYFTMARQMSKSTGAMFTPIGHRLDDDPVPILYIGPTRDNVDDVIEPKVQDMIETTDSLWSKTLRGQKLKKHVKNVGGVTLRFAWAGSDTGLKADAAGLVFIDEIDGIEAERPVAGEGTVLAMAEAIVSTFPEGKVSATSTPTHGAVESEVHPDTGLEHWAPSEEVVSAIWRYWQASTRHEWAVPCPSCRSYFIPRSKLLGPREGVTPMEARERAHVRCPACAAHIDPTEREWMNARGVMVAPGQKPAPYDDDQGEYGLEGPVGPGPMVSPAPGAPPERVDWGDFILPERSTSASFWVSGLMTFSARNSWGHILDKLLKAIKSGIPAGLQGVYNTLLGECYLLKGDTPPWQEVKALAKGSPYRLGEVPDAVTLLTVGTDLKDDEIQYVIRGWAPERDGSGDVRSYLIDRGVVDGPTDQEATWAVFRDKVVDRYVGGLKPALVAIDAAHREQAVYDFCARNPTCIPTWGVDTMDSWWKAIPPEVDSSGKVRRYGLKLWRLNTDVTKSWVYSQIKRSAREERVWFVPSDIDDEYCKQVTAESRMVLENGKIKWQRHRPNHWLDCEAQSWFASNQVVIPLDRPAPPKPLKASGHRSGGLQSWGHDDPFMQ